MQHQPHNEKAINHAKTPPDSTIICWRWTGQPVCLKVRLDGFRQWNANLLKLSYKCSKTLWTLSLDVYIECLTDQLVFYRPNYGYNDCVLQRTYITVSALTLRNRGLMLQRTSDWLAAVVTLENRCYVTAILTGSFLSNLQPWQSQTCVISPWYYVLIQCIYLKNNTFTNSDRPSA